MLFYENREATKREAPLINTNNIAMSGIMF